MPKTLQKILISNMRFELVWRVWRQKGHVAQLLLTYHIGLIGFILLTMGLKTPRRPNWSPSHGLADLLQPYYQYPDKEWLKNIILLTTKLVTYPGRGRITIEQNHHSLLQLQRTTRKSGA